MNKNKKTVHELLQEREAMFQKREALDLSMAELVDKAKAENRPLSAEENVKYQQMQNEFNKLGREIAMSNDQVMMIKQRPADNMSQNEMLREAFASILKGGGQKEYSVMQREWTAGVQLSNVTEGGMIPLTIKDILPPLEMGLVFDKVGIPVETGVTGDISWPVMGSVEASIKGEKEALTDTGIDLTHISPTKVRVGITIPVTYQAINSSSSDLLSIVSTQARRGITRLLNRVTFSHQNFTSGFHGPFAGAKTSGTFAGAAPTYAELLKMKGAVYGTGVEPVGFCFVMSEAMKATLEATPIDAGSGKMIVENGTIAGYPVFTTEFVNYGSNQKKDSVEHIAAGCFGYLPVNQYGELRVTIDPYTRAKEDIVQVTINSDWSMTTLRAEAFAMYKCAAAGA